MNVALCILAKDEARNICGILQQLLAQSLLSDPSQALTVHVVANGCSDNTVELARSFKEQFQGRNIDLLVQDTQPGGKSRAWNRAVHEFIGSRTDVIVFMDADIKFFDKAVLAELIDRLEATPDLMAAAGYPIKDLLQQSGVGLIDRLSLEISSDTRHADSISGQLYAARGNCLREIWLPDETPGEDGFLNAMINTRGFTLPHQNGLVRGHHRPTHYYEALGPKTFLKHERRLIVATMINVWIFEHLMSLKLSKPAGPLIKRWNESRPRWVEEITRERTAGRRWVISNEVLGKRLVLADRKKLSDWKSFPPALVATALTLPPAWLANRRLRQTGAASIW